MAVSRVTVLTLATLLLGNAESRAGEGASKPLDGSWETISVEWEGKSDAWATANTTMTFEGDRFDSAVAQDVNSGHFRTNADVKPAQIDLTFEHGNATGMKRYGVFRLTGNDFYIALPTSTEERPTTLESRKGCGCVVMHLVRRPTSVPQPSFVENVTSLTNGAKEIVVSGQFNLSTLGNQVQSVNLRERLEQAAKAECGGASYELTSVNSIGNQAGKSGGPKFTLKGVVRCIK